MPRAPKRCARCTNIVQPGATYCPEHQPDHGWTSHPSANAKAHTREERRAFHDAVLARDPWCRACGIRPATEADHIIPVSRGGSNDPNNGQGLCQLCHARKTRNESRRR